MKAAIEATADIKLDEKEYQQMAFSYASVRVSGDNLTDDDIKTNKENIQKFFDKVKEDPTADFSTLGDEISTVRQTEMLIRTMYVMLSVNWTRENSIQRSSRQIPSGM